MCGIAGIIDSTKGINPNNIKDMTDSISHRGPDAEGFLFVGHSESKICQQFEQPGYRPIYALA